MAKDKNNHPKFSIFDTNSSHSSGDPYQNFRNLLMTSETFPTFFTFKIIVKAGLNKINALQEIFNHPSAKLETTNQSSTGKYETITVTIFVATADTIIEYYKAVSKLEDVLIL